MKGAAGSRPLLIPPPPEPEPELEAEPEPDLELEQDPAQEPAPPPDKELSDVDLRAVKVILEEIDDHLMGGLLSVDIISKASGMSLAGINSAPKACALFNRLSEQLHSALTKSEDSLADDVLHEH